MYIFNTQTLGICYLFIMFLLIIICLLLISLFDVQMQVTCCGVCLLHPREVNMH